MADITLRSVKGSPLTNSEVDANFTNLNNEITANRVETVLQAGLGIDLSYSSGDNELKIDSNHVEVSCTNQSGSTIAKGTPVYQTGTSGNNITIAPADADSAATMPAVGITTSELTNGAEGTIVILGVVTGLDTSSFSEGDVLYISATAGQLTATKPSGETSLIQNFGRVLKVNASNGSIAVMGAGRTNDVPNLAHREVFIGTASETTEKRALVEADISDLGTYLTQATADTLYEPLIATANRMTFYRQATQPSGGTYREGDMWYKTDDEDLYFYREVSTNVFNWVLLSTATDNSDTLDGGSY